MSFLSILKTVGRVAVGAEHVAAPIAEVLMPQFAGPIAALDGVFQKLVNGVVATETVMTQPSTGPQKAAAVTSDFAAGLSLTQEILAMEGKSLTWDDAALQDAISKQVAAFNAMAAVKASFKITPVSATAPVKQ